MSPAHGIDRACGVRDAGAVTAFTGCEHPSKCREGRADTTGGPGRQADRDTFARWIGPGRGDSALSAARLPGAGDHGLTDVHRAGRGRFPPGHARGGRAARRVGRPIKATRQPCPPRSRARRPGLFDRSGSQNGWPADSNKKSSRLGIVTALPKAGFDRRHGRSERARIASEGRRRRMPPSSVTSSIVRKP